MKPREPNTRELFELMILEVEKFAVDGKYTVDDEETVEGWIQGAAIAVFDNYITDGPGYAGKLMVVVWPGSPDEVSAYTWRKALQAQRAKIEQVVVGGQYRRPA